MTKPTGEKKKFFQKLPESNVKIKFWRERFDKNVSQRIGSTK